MAYSHSKDLSPGAGGFGLVEGSRRERELNRRYRKKEDQHLTAIQAQLDDLIVSGDGGSGVVKLKPRGMVQVKAVAFADAIFN